MKTSAKRKFKTRSMDELKLDKWKENFETEVKNIQVEYDSFFLNRQFDSIYNITLNESNEWELQIDDNLPNEIKNRFQQVFLNTKPEDSV